MGFMADAHRGHSADILWRSAHKTDHRTQIQKIVLYHGTAECSKSVESGDVHVGRAKAYISRLLPSYWSVTLLETRIMHI